MSNDKFNVLIVIGMPELEATALLENEGFKFVRTVERNGKSLKIAKNINAEYFNLFVIDDKVYKFSRG